MTLGVAILAFASVCVGACTRTDIVGHELVDTGVDAGTDANLPDAGFDANLPDGGLDANVPDTGLDANIPDSGNDAGLDANIPDAGTDADLPDAHVPGCAESLPTARAFCFTGSDQMFVVPAGVTSLSVKLWGAAGGSDMPLPLGGNGGFVADAALSVVAGETLTIVVGGAGTCGSGDNAATYGGGGRGSDHPTFAWGTSGGGRSAIRRGTTELITAGGGGGIGYSSESGTGGQGCAGGGGAGGDGTFGGDGMPGHGGGAGQGGGVSAGGAAGTATGPGSLSGHPGTMLQGGAGLLIEEDLAGTRATSGGGGGGYFGGGSGGWRDNITSGAGGGGSCFVPAGATFEGGSAAGPGGMTDPDYDGVAGRIVAVCPGSGAPGRVVIHW